MERYVQGISGIIGILLSVHYFYSYMWWQGFLSLHELSMFAIINFDDISYTFGEANYILILFNSIGLIWAYVWMIMGVRLVPTENTKTPWKDIQEKSIIEIRKAPWLFVMVAAFLLWTISFYIYNYSALTYYQFLVLVMIFGCPILTAIYYQQAKSIFFLFWGLSILAGVKTIDKIVSDMQNDKSVDTSHITFQYQGEKKGSLPGDRLVFFGYKYIVLKNIQTKQYSFFPPEQVTNIVYAPSK